MKKQHYILLLLAVIIIFIFVRGNDGEAEPQSDVSDNATFIDLRSRDIPTPNADIILPEGTLYAYAIRGESTGAAGINLSFLEDGGYPVLNLAIDINGDGSIASYETENGTQDEWVLQNTPAYILGDLDTSYTVDFFDTDALGNESLNAFAIFSSDALEAGWHDDEGVRDITLSVTAYELNEILGLDVPGNGPDIYRGGASHGFYRIAHAQGNNSSIPDLDIDLDYNIGDLPQQSMECAPTSITNNMLGLAEANGRRSDLPSADTLVRQLKEDLKFGDEGRAGVLDKNYIAGKNAFMNRYNFPIITTEISNPSFEDIADALGDGAVIEMDLAFFERNAQGRFVHSASHVVTLTGISSDGGEFELRGRDSATPDGGESWRFFPKQEGRPQSQIAYPKNRTGATIINKIYVQRWVTVDEAISAGVLPAGAVGSTYPVEMLVIDGNYYPKQQFRVAGPDRCKEDHYHKDTEAAGLRDKTSTNLAFKSDPARDGCGFGAVSKVPVETVRLTWEQQQALAGALTTP